MRSHYDYIICGAGAAGLSLAIRMNSAFFVNKKILLIDQERRDSNDHTWCFWQKETSLFENILEKTWDSLQFYSKDLDKKINILPYRYKMLRSKSFYDFAFDIIDQASNIDFFREEIKSIESGQVSTLTKTFSANHIFSSIQNYKTNDINHLSVSQHFGGYFIQLSSGQFDTSQAVFMDFRIDHNDDCRFGYILPISNDFALVEIAEFSNQVLDAAAYDVLLTRYLSEYFPDYKYQIVEKEYGIIPMSTYPYWQQNQKQITYIGLAGGSAKASTGFAFASIQKHCQFIISNLEHGSAINHSLRPKKYQWFDRIFLNVLIHKRVKIADVFTMIFKNTNHKSLLKFLADEGSIRDDLNVINSCPKLPFIKAMIDEMF